MSKPTVLVGAVVGMCLLATILIMEFNEQTREQSRRIIEIGTEVRELRDLYLAYHDKHKKPPNCVEDLLPYSKKWPTGYQALLAGKYVVCWGTPLVANPRGNDARILAYDSQLPTRRAMVWHFGGGGIAMIHSDFLAEKARTDLLREVFDLWDCYAKDEGRPPNSVDDLEQYANRFSAAFNAIKNGQWVLSWGVGPTDSAYENYDVILGIESNNTRSSGWILMIDGSSMRLTPKDLRDFQSNVSLSHQIWRLYAAYTKDKGKSPSKIEDLEKYSEKYSNAYQAIESAKWIVQWDVELCTGTDKSCREVLAYRLVESSSGVMSRRYVLMNDNFQEEMWSNELRDALEAQRRKKR